MPMRKQGQTSVLHIPFLIHTHSSTHSGGQEKVRKTKREKGDSLSLSLVSYSGSPYISRRFRESSRRNNRVQERGKKRDSRDLSSH